MVGSGGGAKVGDCGALGGEEGKALGGGELGGAPGGDVPGELGVAGFVVGDAGGEGGEDGVLGGGGLVAGEGDAEGFADAAFGGVVERERPKVSEISGFDLGSAGVTAVAQGLGAGEVGVFDFVACGG